MMMPLSRALTLAGLLAASGAAAAAPGEVVVYATVDDVFARPVAERFTASTGIAVKLVPDTEETKSTGLLNRAIAEKSRPQADVFWSGDPIRAEILKLRGVSTSYRSPNAEGLPADYSDPDGYWTGFSSRVRVILYNTSRLREADAPRSIFDFVNNGALRGGVCFANPLFGTTSMHAAAIFAVLGDAGGRDYFEGLTHNRVRMVSSNGEVRRRVAEGDCAAGIADSDDAHEAIKDGKPVAVVYPDDGGIGTLLVPNAAVLIANSPNHENGKKFIDYLLSAGTERALAESDAAQLPLRPDVAGPPSMRGLSELHPMKLDYHALALRLDELSRGFLKQWADRNRP
jgi:iron(III) transport system substrate-binding protein